MPKTDRVTETAAAIAMAGLTVGVRAQTCDDNNTLSPWVCVDWSQGADPEETIDFTYDFSDADNPGVTLIGGDLGWVIWSRVSETDTAPANLGDIKIAVPSLPNSDDFEVTIDHVGNSNPGADDVASINLTTTGWTGFSSIENSSSIKGDLNGPPAVQAESGSGGSVHLTVAGQITGDVTARAVQTLQAFGGTTGVIDVDEVLSVGVIRIGDPFSPDCGTTRMTGALTIGTLRTSATPGIEGGA